MDVNDKPGVIGTIGTICGKHNINFASLLHKDATETEEQSAEVVVITAEAKESDIQDAINELQSNDCIKEVKSLIRVMD